MVQTMWAEMPANKLVTAHELAQDYRLDVFDTHRLAVENLTPRGHTGAINGAAIPVYRYQDLNELIRPEN